MRIIKSFKDVKPDYYVYVLYNQATGEIFYVGKGSGRRVWHHIWQARNTNNNSYKLNVIRQIERENNQVGIAFIRDELTEDDAFMWECFWIAEYGRRDLGTGCLANLTDGGDGVSGHKHSDKTKRLMADTKKGQTMKEEIKRKISESMKGRVRGPYRKHQSSKNCSSEISVLISATSPLYETM